MFGEIEWVKGMIIWAEKHYVSISSIFLFITGSMMWFKKRKTEIQLINNRLEIIEGRFVSKKDLKEKVEECSLRLEGCIRKNAKDLENKMNESYKDSVRMIIDHIDRENRK